MSPPPSPFTLQEGNIFAVPLLHYNMEMAAQVRLAFQALQPDAVAVELAQTLQDPLCEAASRLPDISVVITHDHALSPIYYLCEPCDGAFEGLRSALESQIPAYCIDLDVDAYPETKEFFPDPYAIHKIGLERYYTLYKQEVLQLNSSRGELDFKREEHMARQLKELSLRHEKVLFIGGMFHVERVLELTKKSSFSSTAHAKREGIHLCTLTEPSCRDVLGEFGWISYRYEQWRREELFSPPDRQELLLKLFKAAGEMFEKEHRETWMGSSLSTLMKFSRNYALVKGGLMPNLYQILSAAKGCVDHNYAYETWKLATAYPYLRNVDQLEELDLSIEDIWKHSKLIRFHRKEKSRKGETFHRRLKQARTPHSFSPPSPFTICSYPPEDLAIEGFGSFLQKKGTQILSEEGARTQPFSSSLEDGIDTKETIRHWHEQKLYIKVQGKPPGAAGSVVLIFDEDLPQEKKSPKEQFPWTVTWLGEHQQESDMAFYATEQKACVVGPGITRCEYGGFMMSYPPRRMYDIWSDPDYASCRSKAEVLLMAAIDYSVKPIIVYAAPRPPRSFFKGFAQRFGKKVVYIPLGQFSPLTLKKLRSFHVLDGHDKRQIADDYIF